MAKIDDIIAVDKKADELINLMRPYTKEANNPYDPVGLLIGSIRDNVKRFEAAINGRNS